MPSGKIRNPVEEDWLRLTNKRMWPLDPEEHPLRIRTRTASIIKAIPGVGIPLDPEMLGKGPGTMSVTSDGKFRPDQRWQYKEAAADDQTQAGITPQTTPPPVPTPQPQTPQPPTPQPASPTEPAAQPAVTPTPDTVGVPSVGGQPTPDTTGIAAGTPPATGPDAKGAPAAFQPASTDRPDARGITGFAPQKPEANPYATLPQIPSEGAWYRVMGPQSYREYRTLQMLYDQHPNLVANSRIPALMAQLVQSIEAVKKIDVESANPYELQMQRTAVQRTLGLRNQLLQEINNLRSIATQYRNIKLKHPTLPETHAQFAATVMAIRPAFEAAQRRAGSLLNKGLIDQQRAMEMINNQLAFSLSRYTGTSAEEVPPEMINTAKQILMGGGELPSEFVNSQYVAGYVPNFVENQAEVAPQQAAQPPVRQQKSSVSFESVGNIPAAAPPVSARLWREQHVAPTGVAGNAGAAQNPFGNVAQGLPGSDLSALLSALLAAVGPYLQPILAGIAQHLTGSRTQPTDKNQSQGG